jgi:hypothetical protein
VVVVTPNKWQLPVVPLPVHWKAATAAVCHNADEPTITSSASSVVAAAFEGAKTAAAVNRSTATHTLNLDIWFLLIDFVANLELVL